MKRFGWILLLLAASAPAWAAAKVTVAELKDKLVALQQANKDDEAVATQLKELDLSEQMTPGVKSDLLQYARGPLATEQLDIMEGRSAFLAPPASSLPATAAPDSAAQKAILAKVADSIASTFLQNPPMLVAKVTSRYQDNAGNTSSSVGLKIDSPNTYAMLWEARSEPVESEKGIEKAAASRAKTKWGANGQISEGEPGPCPAAILHEATSAGKVAWLRWETIEAKPAAVFSFAVDKKKSHYDVSYCCFPDTDTQSGIAAAGTFAPIPGEIQSVTTWKPFKKVVGYHGELFIDPEKGTLVRMNIYAELKPSDFIHQEARRIDYGPVVVDGKEYQVPVDSYIVNEAVPGGDSSTYAYTARHTLFMVTYQNYQMAGAAQK